MDPQKQPCVIKADRQEGHRLERRHVSSPRLSSCLVSSHWSLFFSNLLPPALILQTSHSCLTAIFTSILFPLRSYPHFSKLSSSSSCLIWHPLLFLSAALQPAITNPLWQLLFYILPSPWCHPPFSCEVRTPCGVTHCKKSGCTCKRATESQTTHFPDSASYKNIPLYNQQLF